MTEATTTLYIRFLLDVPTEEPAYVDIEFVSPEQAHEALSALAAGKGQLISVPNSSGVPVLLSADRIVAAFPVEFEDNEEDEEDEE